MKNPDSLPAEDALVASLVQGLPQSSRTLTGPGDDCAVIAIPGSPMLQLFKADAIVEGIHFTRRMPPRGVGRKALARAVSDIAAMGGSPSEAMITLVLPPDVSWQWVQEVYEGLRKAAAQWHVGLAGGETSSAPPGAPVMLSVALTGEVAPSRVIRRNGAGAGDVIAVTGKLGNSFASGWHLHFEPRLEQARWLAQHFPPHAMMDLSDGLARDLPRMCSASNTGWHLRPEELPLRDGSTLQQALTEGEDYELLLAIPPEQWSVLSAAWKEQFPDLPLTPIGEMTVSGIQKPALSGGWDHFNRKP